MDEEDYFYKVKYFSTSIKKGSNKKLLQPIFKNRHAELKKYDQGSEVRIILRTREFLRLMSSEGSHSVWAVFS